MSAHPALEQFLYGRVKKKAKKTIERETLIGLLTVGRSLVNPVLWESTGNDFSFGFSFPSPPARLTDGWCHPSEVTSGHSKTENSGWYTVLAASGTDCVDGGGGYWLVSSQVILPRLLTINECHACRQSRPRLFLSVHDIDTDWWPRHCQLYITCARVFWTGNECRM